MNTQLTKHILTLLAFVSSAFAPAIGQHSEFYGMSSSGGEFSAGTIFKTNGNGDSMQMLYNFPCYDGVYPASSLCKASNGKFYGVTVYGANDYGVLFEWDPVSNTFIKKLNFNGVERGQEPFSSLLQAKNGKLYGMTYSGGLNNYGVLFEWDPSTGIYVKKLDFAGVDNGSRPQGSLMQADNGKIFGMTTNGGINDCGVLFEWDPVNNIFTKRLDFSAGESGCFPMGSLIQADNGKLYGMTSGGGAYDCGVLFEWNPALNSFIKKIDFNDEIGSHPLGSLIKANNGILYGTALYGGVNNNGVLFEWNSATDTFIKKLDFNRTENVSTPMGSLVQAANGKFYGIAGAGQFTPSGGAIFEWDSTTNICTTKHGFQQAGRRNCSGWISSTGR